MAITTRQQPEASVKWIMCSKKLGYTELAIRIQRARAVIQASLMISRRLGHCGVYLMFFFGKEEEKTKGWRRVR